MHMRMSSRVSGHTVALTRNGEVFIWGHGDLTVPNDSRKRPASINIKAKRITQIACGGSHTLLLTDAGQVLALYVCLFICSLYYVYWYEVC